MIPGAGPRSRSASLCFRNSLRFHSSFYFFGRPSPSASLIVSNPLHTPNVSWPHPSPTCALLTFPSSSVQLLRSSRQLCHVPFLLNVPVVQPLVLPFYCKVFWIIFCVQLKVDSSVLVFVSTLQELIPFVSSFSLIAPMAMMLCHAVRCDPSYISVRAAADI